MKRLCDNCKKEYEADSRNLKRGWGLTCSKSCAAKKREMGKPSYNKDRVMTNNIRRAFWNDSPKLNMVTGYTDEGYRIINGIAYDKWDEPVYSVDPNLQGENDHGQWADL